MGAQIVALHGETIVEPVESGTNMAGVKSTSVDILAHPGLLTLEEGKIANQNNVFLELSARKGHSLSNGHVAKIAQQTGASLVLNSDTHHPSDLLNIEHATQIAAGAGLGQKEIAQILNENPLQLLKKISS